jgi:hypothetical protein
MRKVTAHCHGYGLRGAVGEGVPKWGKWPYIAPGSRCDLQAEQSLEEPERGIIIINLNQLLEISCRRTKNSLVV